MNLFSFTIWVRFETSNQNVFTCNTIWWKEFKCIFFISCFSIYNFKISGCNIHNNISSILNIQYEFKFRCIKCFCVNNINRNHSNTVQKKFIMKGTCIFNYSNTRCFIIFGIKSSCIYTTDYCSSKTISKTTTRIF